METNVWFINRADKVNWPPLRDSSADVSSVSQPFVRGNPDSGAASAND